MDEVWDEYGCNNLDYDPDKISRFYRHPVWLLNHLFIEQDEISMTHRRAITAWIMSHRADIRRILDYGGGFGLLACMINKADPAMRVDIYEPYPGRYASEKVRAFPGIHFVNSVGEGHDCLICMDVLEHLPRPLETLSEMVRSVRMGGYLIIANCFQPVIKCHLPATFHLRFSFNLFTWLLGLRLLEQCDGTHAHIFQRARHSDISAWWLAFLQGVSKAMFPFLNAAHKVYRSIVRKDK